MKFMNIRTEYEIDGLDDPLDLFASPRMPVRPCSENGKHGGYSIMALYVANLSTGRMKADHLKWACPPHYRRDLYRRYYGKDPGNTQTGLIEGNDNIGPERGQTLNVDDGAFYDSVTQKYGLDEFQDDKMTDETRNNTLNEIVKDIMKQILDTNFINMVAYARGWAVPPT